MRAPRCWLHYRNAPAQADTRVGATRLGRLQASSRAYPGGNNGNSTVTTSRHDPHGYKKDAKLGVDWQQSEDDCALNPKLRHAAGEALTVVAPNGTKI